MIEDMRAIERENCSHKWEPTGKREIRNAAGRSFDICRKCSLMREVKPSEESAETKSAE